MPKFPSPNSVPKALRRLAVSEKRLAANRADAAQATVPGSCPKPDRQELSQPQVRQAAETPCRHGFTATSFTVARFEEIREIERLKADAVSVNRPVNAQEMFAVERIALAQQQILRGARLESGLFTDAFDSAIDSKGSPICAMSADMIEGNVPITRAQNRNFALAEGFRRTAGGQSNAWTLMLRYQAQAERMYRRAIEEFERLKALRPHLPNEPIWQDQSEEKPDLATLEDLSVNVSRDYQYTPDPNGADPYSPLDAIPHSEPRPEEAVQPTPAAESSQPLTPPANS